jgi:hypothetical protein
MIIYKVDDKPIDENLNVQIREIATELAAMAPKLQNLYSIVTKHGDTISAPSIVEFRRNLQRMVGDASTLTQRISQNSLTLIEVSEQASKQLTAIEQHYSTILRDRTPIRYLNENFDETSGPAS